MQFVFVDISLCDALVEGGVGLLKLYTVCAMFVFYLNFGCLY